MHVFTTPQILTNVNNINFTEMKSLTEMKSRIKIQREYWGSLVVREPALDFYL